MSASLRLDRRRDQAMEAGALLGLMVLALVGHGILLAVLWVAPWLATMIFPEPPPPDLVEIAMIELKHSDGEMAQMDTRKAQPDTPVDTEAPEPVELDAGVTEEGTTEPVEAPNPSDLEYQTPDAPEQKQGDPDRRANLLDELDKPKQRSRADLLAALGTEDSEAGDPDSNASETIDLGGVGKNDPEMARYVNRLRKLFYAQFNPLPQLKSIDPPLTTRIFVKFDMDTGRIESFSFSQRSGNGSWDGAAERAVEAVKSVPPPPERLRETLRAGMNITFSPEDT